MIKLYGDPRSGNTRKVRWAFEELGVSYELVMIDLGQREQRSASYLNVNPNGRVPTIDDDGFVLWESDAILWYLADNHGRGRIVPESVRERALVQQWMSWNMNHLAEVAYRPRVMRRVAARAGTTYDQAEHARLVAAAPPVLAILEGHLAGREFLVGDRFSIADLAVGMNVSYGVEEGIALAQFGNIRNWFERLTARPAWQK